MHLGRLMTLYTFPSPLQPWLLSLGLGLIALVVGRRSLWLAAPVLAVLVLLVFVAVADAVQPLPSDTRPSDVVSLLAAPLVGLAIGVAGTLWGRASRKRAA